MFNFGSSKQTERCAAIIDVGSGSVGVAIVVVAGKDDSTIVWSHREHVLLRTSGSLKETERSLKTAIINMYLELGNAGVRALHEFNPALRLTDTQVSVTAPWQYTAAKNVDFNDEEPFVVDSSLIRDLTKLASEDAMERAESTGVFSEFGLSSMHESSIGITLNGYQMQDYLNKKATQLSFVHLTMLGATALLAVITEGHEKVAPKTKLTVRSFMYTFYDTIATMYPHTREAALIDVTSEATEIGIIRDGALRYVTHMPIGSYTLSRKLSEVLNIPSEEAYTYLKTTTEYGNASMSETLRKKVNTIFEAYEEELVKLLQQTGDNLLIPPALFVHNEMSTEHFFKTVLKKAAKRVTGNTHTIHPVTSQLISDSHTGDTAIILGVRHFIIKTQ